MIKLKDVASVQLGVLFKSKIENIQQARYHVVQMKDLTEENEIDFASLYGIDTASVKEKHLLRQGDILFRSRGKNNTSVLVNEEVGNLVIASPLMRIRCTSTEIIPSYLSWLINHPVSQSYFFSMAQGSSVQMIDKKTIEDLQVIKPSLKVQQAISEIADLSKREQKILVELGQKKQLYMDKLLLEIAQKRFPG